METLFDWIDARPRRRFLLRAVIYSLFLWTAVYLLYLLAAHLFNDTGGRPPLRDQFTHASPHLVLREQSLSD